MQKMPVIYKQKRIAPKRKSAILSLWERNDAVADGGLDRDPGPD